MLPYNRKLLLPVHHDQVHASSLASRLHVVLRRCLGSLHNLCCTPLMQTRLHRRHGRVDSSVLRRCACYKCNLNEKLCRHLCSVPCFSTTRMRLRAASQACEICHSDGCQHVATEMDSFTTELLCQKPSHAITKPTPSPELNAAHHCSLTESLKFHCRQLPRLADRLPKPPEQGRAVFVLHIFGKSDDTTSALCLSSLQALPVSCGSVD